MARSTHQEPSTAIASVELPNAIRSLIHAVDKDIMIESFACAVGFQPLRITGSQ